MKRFKAQITNLTNNKNFLENNKYNLTKDAVVISLYVDGDFKEDKTINMPAPLESTKMLCLGGDNRTGNTECFKGKIYSLYLFDKVRTPSQIKNDVGKTSIDSSDIIYEKVESNGMTFKESSRIRIPKYNLDNPDNDPSIIPLTVEARIEINSSDRQGVIVGNYGNSSYYDNDGKSFNVEIYTNWKVRVYYKGDKHWTFNFNLEEYLEDSGKLSVDPESGEILSVDPVDIALTFQYIQYMEGINITDVDIKYTIDENSPQNITTINEPYLNILKDRMKTAGISLENNNIFFYKVQDILKLYTKDKDGNIYPINVQSVNNARGVSASAIEPILYNIFMNKLLDYSIADTFDRTYLQNNDQS